MARRVTGVLDQAAFVILSLARSSRAEIEAAPFEKRGFIKDLKVHEKPWDGSLA